MAVDKLVLERKVKNSTSAAVHANGHNHSKKQIQSHYLKSTLMYTPYNYIGEVKYHRKLGEERRVVLGSMPRCVVGLDTDHAGMWYVYTTSTFYVCG